MNIRHAYSKEDPSPDERLLWGALVDDADALALLRIGYSAGEAHVEARIGRAKQAGYNAGYDQGWDDGENAALSRESVALEDIA